MIRTVAQYSSNSGGYGFLYSAEGVTSLIYSYHFTSGVPYSEEFFETFIGSKNATTFKLEFIY